MTAALAFQLLLVFFVPPFAFGARKIYAADLWCMLWVAYAFFRYRHDFRTRMRPIAVVVLLISFIYAHGAFRPSIRTALESELLFLNETDAFQGAREAYVALRFLSWILAIFFVHHWFAMAKANAETEALFKVLSRTLAACLALASLGLIADHAFPAIRTVLGHIFGHDPAYFYWNDRSYGFFASPVEAGAAMVFGAILFYLANRRNDALKRPWHVVTLLLTAVALLCTKTLTPFIGLLMAAATVLLSRLPRQQIRKLALLGIPTIGAMLIAFSLTHQGDQKIRNFTGRIGPWRIFIREAFSRLDTAFLGFGFAPYHTDNFFLFLFTRGGLVTLGLFLAALAAYVRNNSKRWSSEQKFIIYYLFVTALTTDALIFRHIICLLFAAAIPLLVIATHSENKRS